MRLIISVVLVLIFSLPAKSQSYNEILSHFEKHESENPDSALFYALQLKDAALNEYGLTREAKYFKALNTIGIQYFDHNEVSIAEHYFHTVFELISKHGKDSFPNTLSLTTDYLYYIQLAYHHQIDSAMFYADEMLRQDLKTDWGTGRERINSIVNVAFNFDTTAGYSSAKKYYHLALEKRIELFGQANAYLVSSLDSMLNLRKRDYNASARYLIYSAPDDQLPVDSLAKLAKEAAGQDDWTSIRYASLWKDATGANQRGNIIDYSNAIIYLADGFLDFLDRPDIAAWICTGILDSLKINKQTNSETYITGMKLLSQAEIANGNAWSAIHAAEEFSNAMKKKYGMNSGNYLRSLLWLGDLHRQRCNIDDSCSRLSLQVINEVLRHPLLRSNPQLKADALYQKATTFLRFADLDSAEYYYNNAYWIYKTLKGSLYNISKQLYYVNFYQQDYAKMQAWLKQCIRMAEKDSANFHDQLIDDIQSLLMISFELRDWQQADMAIRRYEGLIPDKSPGSYIFQEFVKYQIELEKLKGNFTNLDKKAMERIQNLSDSSLFLIDTEKRKTGIAGDLSMAYNQLAEIYYGQEKYSQSLDAAHKAWEYNRIIGYDSVMANADIFRSVAQAQYALGLKDSATGMMQLLAGLFKNEDWGQSIQYFRNQVQLSQFLAGNNQVITAEKLMYEAVEALRQDMVLKMAGFNERQRSQYSSLLRESVDQYLDLQQKLFNSGMITAIEHAYETVIRSKGILLQTSLSKNTSKNDSVTVLQRQLIGLKNELARVNSGSVTNSELTKKDSVQSAISALEEKISLVSQNYARFLEDSRMGATDVRRNLKDGEAAIEITGYNFYNDIKRTDSVCYAAFIIRGDKEQIQYVPMSLPAGLSSLVSLQSTASRGFRKDSTEKAKTFYELYRLTWKSLETHLQNIKTVYLSTDGVLNKLSFAALTDSNGNYLLDKYNLHLCSNTKDLIGAARTAMITRPRVDLFGGAQFDASNMAANNDADGDRSLPQQLRGSTGWKYLPGTLTEVKNIEKILHSGGWKSRSFIGNEASEKNLKKLNAASPDIIHIATHGFYFPPEDQEENSDPLFRSGIIMARANHAWLGHFVKSGEEDGIMTAFEISNLDLRNTKLAVLSACETGMGDVVTGEGVYGLQRALKNAGVKFIIVSLWPVPDRETAEMMEHFYKELVRTLDIRNSFREAQQKMRAKYPDAPSKWGAFILIE